MTDHQIDTPPPPIPVLVSLALEIVPYDPCWPSAFSAERDRIAAALGDLALRIEHNGSTSVPGLAAKPIIDIQVSVRRLERRTLAFRDYLREHPRVAQEYEALKRELAPQHSGADFSSREAYAQAKAAFITRVTESALAEGYPLFLRRKDSLGGGVL